ncbi:MAG TPA: TIGR04222 domain-containing membrane protein [Polyangiaceae bacterium]
MYAFDLSGVGFLVFFGSALAFVLLLALASDQLRHPKSALSSAELDALGPYDLACLAGGRSMAADAAVVALVHTGHLSIDAQGRVGREGDVNASVGVHAYRSIALDMHPVERAVFGVVATRPRSIHAVRESASGALEALEQVLVERGLLLGRLQQAFGAVVGTCWLGVPLWFVGAMRILRGASSGYSVGFLLLLMVPLTVFIFMRRRRFPRATYRGDAALHELRVGNAALRTTATAETAQLEARELALAYALFGTTVLTVDLPSLAQVLLFGRLATGRAPSAPSSSIDAGGGFSCAAVGGGCGSSCSAACGGCGGCGS